jgi:hypothetical protein
MAAPQLANVLPFTTKTFGFLKVEGPPALDSAAYAIRQVGSRNFTTRTADQTASAIFWYISTPVPWEAAARAAAQKMNPGLVDNARIFALMNMAGADAYIAAWQIHSGAMAEVMRRLIGTDQLAFGSALLLPSGPLPRSWNSLSEAEKDVTGARIWAGIHFRTADEYGIALGHAIAENAVGTVMRPLAR